MPAIGGAFIAFHVAEEHATPFSKRVREIVIFSVGTAWVSDAPKSNRRGTLELFWYEEYQSTAS